MQVSLETGIQKPKEYKLQFCVPWIGAIL